MKNLDILDAIAWTLYAVGLAACIFGGTAIVMSARADGRIDYCITWYSFDSSSYRVWGHRPWCQDTRVANVQTWAEAEAVMESRLCKVQP